MRAILEDCLTLYVTAFVGEQVTQRGQGPLGRVDHWLGQEAARKATKKV